MFSTEPHVSLADLVDAGVRLRPSEAVAIVRELLLQVIRGDLPGVPSAHVIRLAASGNLFVEGPVAAGGPGVSRAAHLLESLLAAGDVTPETRVCGALRLVLVRAMGTLDLPPYPSLDAFAAALARFAAADLSAVVRELHAARSASMRAQSLARDAASPAMQEPAPSDDDQLTISDIRRARRSTRLSLAEVAERSRIPAWLLRELEWGYYRNWPGGLYGRTQLIRYARAAGLDERLVVRTVWPQLEEAAAARGTVTIAPEDVEPADPHFTNASAMLVPIERAPLVPVAAPSEWRGRRSRVAALIAIPALIGVALVPALLDRAEAPPTPAAVGASVRSTPQARSSAAPSVPRREAPEVPARREVTEVQARRDVSEVPAPPDVRAPEKVPPVVRAALAPDFSSAGSVSFSTGDDGDGGVMRTAAGGRAPLLRMTRVVDDKGRNFHARPSPDGTRIAFDSDRDGERAVYVADADGGHVRRVSGDGFAAIPSWSPDGRRLAYVRAEAGRPNVWNLWMVDVETRETRRLTSARVGQPRGASWFPDGQRLAYSRGSELVILDTESGQERTFQSPMSGRPLRGAAVAPDGRRIIFHVDRNGAWLLDLPSGAMRRVLTDPRADEYTWSPDGRRLAYLNLASGTWNIWIPASR